MNKKQLKVKNGIAQPLGKGYYLMNGPSHEQGGIDIGKNLEVEGGEIVKLNPKSIKVLSNAKIMGDMTPAEYALGGLKDGTFEEKYNKGFKYQEKFKDINNLKDDGTKAEMGIFKKIKNWIFGDKESTENQEVFQYRRVLPSDIESTKKRTESFENHIVNNINAQLRANPRGIEYNIPYVYDKEIKVDGVGRLSTNMLDSLAVNLPIANETLKKAGKPELTFRDAVGLAGEETNFGASPNVSLDAWIKKYKQDNNGKEPSDEEKHEYERALLNMSVARNFGGIPAPYLINNHSSYYSQGWKNSIYGKHLNNVESPLANGLIQYGLGIYNTNAKYHTTSVQNKGNTILNDKDVKKWLNDNKEKYNLKLGGQMKKKYRIGGNVNLPSTGKRIKADLGIEVLKPITITEKKKLLPTFDNKAYALNTPTIDTSEWGKPREPEFLKPVLTNDNLTSPAIQQKPVDKLYSNSEIKNYLEDRIKRDKTERLTNNRDSILNAGDWINMGTNAATAITDLIVGLTTPDIKAVKYADPISYQAFKNKTRVNITPRLQELRKTINKYNKSINENTISSKVNLNRLRDINLLNLDKINEIYGYKENRETELINKDIKNLQEIINKNIKEINTIDQKNLENEIAAFNINRGGVGDTISGFIHQLAEGTSSNANAIERRKSDMYNKAMTYLANPNVKISDFKEGLKEILEELKKARLGTNYKIRRYTK